MAVASACHAPRHGKQKGISVLRLSSLCPQTLPLGCHADAGRPVLVAPKRYRRLHSSLLVGISSIFARVFPLVKLRLNLLEGRFFCSTAQLLIFSKWLQRTALNILIYSQRLS